MSSSTDQTPAPVVSEEMRALVTALKTCVNGRMHEYDSGELRLLQAIATLEEKAWRYDELCK